ncbi:phosphatidate cytidylyltransferase [Mesomycoplasma hyorhinis]|uniref:phosphatidate cytidylyltransferase n=1 Tax=Mesomycoplasma hyorhinis TaxID=2100 RepID=UPI001C05DF5B|nr:phosphatidate cytidylyltransferase [Mesomycoplasma hyorhinis]UVT33563.1 phosphatidate cytidylyltransferase [Mesomycoplasma hyorhinis]
MLSLFKTDKSQKIIKKSSIAILIVFFILPIIFITYYAGLPGRIIGFIIYFSIFSYGAYEIFAKVNKNVVINLLVLINIFCIFILPFNEFRFSIETGDVSLNSFILIHYKSWENYLISFGLVLVCALFEPIEWRQRTRNFIIRLVFSYLIGTFTKFLFFININKIELLVVLGLIASFYDVFGYFFGSWLGRKWIKKGFSKISPNKSWEGVFFGFLFSATFVALAFYFIPYFSINYSGVQLSILIGVSFFALPIAAILGDLLFSFIKRSLNIKDFSTLIKSHGGVFDRFDSTFLVVIIFSIISPIISLF